MHQPTPTSKTDFHFLCRLAQGSFGTVYKVQHKITKITYVLKQISTSQLSPILKTSALNEVSILSTLKNPYIVKYFDSFIDNDILNIVMEYCEGGDLSNYIRSQKGNPIAEDLVWKFFIQICVGLSYIHSKKILHRDIKTMNIFLTKEGDIRIGDLGIAKTMTDSASFAQTLVGTLYYLSPEMCEEKPYNEKSDIWALGCVLYELCTQKHPFEASSHMSLLLRILKGNYNPIPENYSRDMMELVDICLCKDYKKRPSAEELLKRSVVIEKARKLKIKLSTVNEVLDKKPGKIAGIKEGLSKGNKVIQSSLKCQIDRKLEVKTPTKYTPKAGYGRGNVSPFFQEKEKPASCSAIADNKGKVNLSNVETKKEIGPYNLNLKERLPKTPEFSTQQRSMEREKALSRIVAYREKERRSKPTTPRGTISKEAAIKDRVAEKFGNNLQSKGDAVKPKFINVKKDVVSQKNGFRVYKRNISLEVENIVEDISQLKGQYNAKSLQLDQEQPVGKTRASYKSDLNTEETGKKCGPKKESKHPLRTITNTESKTESNGSVNTLNRTALLEEYISPTKGPVPVTIIDKEIETFDIVTVESEITNISISNPNNSQEVSDEEPYEEDIPHKEFQSKRNEKLTESRVRENKQDIKEKLKQEKAKKQKFEEMIKKSSDNFVSKWGYDVFSELSNFLRAKMDSESKGKTGEQIDEFLNHTLKGETQPEQVFYIITNILPLEYSIEKVNANIVKYNRDLERQY